MRLLIGQWLECVSPPSQWLEQCIYRDTLGLLKIGFDKNAPNLGSKNLIDKLTKKDKNKNRKIIKDN